MKSTSYVNPGVVKRIEGLCHTVPKQTNLVAQFNMLRGELACALAKMKGFWRSWPETQVPAMDGSPFIENMLLSKYSAKPQGFPAYPSTSRDGRLIIGAVVRQHPGRW